MSIMDPASKFICNKHLAFSMSHGPSIVSNVMELTFKVQISAIHPTSNTK